MEKSGTGRKNKNGKPIMIYPMHKKSSFIDPTFNTVEIHSRYIKWI
jgi:hypothetical protein